MRNKILAAAAFFVLVAGLTFVVTTSASAHTQWNCQHGAACLFYDTNGGPAGASHLTLYFSTWVTPQDPPGTCHDLPTTWFNTASSVVSDYGSGYDLILFENAGCTDIGDKFVSPRHVNFTGWWAFLNDDVQSFKIAL